MPFLEEGMMTLLNSIIVVFLLQFLHGLSQLSLVQNSPFSLISDKKGRKAKSVTTIIGSQMDYGFIKKEC